MSELAVPFAYTQPPEQEQLNVVKRLEIIPDNPLINKDVAGLGEAALRDVRTTGRGTEQRPTRLHRLYTIGLNEHNHAVEITDPVKAEPSFTVFSYPGYTEHIESSMRQEMHSHLSYIFPEARIVSIASNGIGKTGSRYEWTERSEHGLQEMGAQRVDLARALGGNKPVFTMGTSMGTVVAHHMASENLKRPDGQGVDLRGQVWLSPAVVDPKQIYRDMALRFPIGLVKDVAKELTFKTKPSDLLRVGRLTLHHGFHTSDLVALTHQVLELLEGTPEADLDALIEQVPTVVVTGEHDSLAQHEMYKRLQAKHPTMLQFESIRGHGHELAMKPQKACHKLSYAGRLLVSSQLAKS